ncbi:MULTISPECIES: S-layer homology domain-containing protein [unclassified Lysinibacillus]|uniref:S-layer homology domain-containing protein n=1 Tax=unclassified Lysinibacillus TaxID=2636778 RepID=UPI0025528771|nr:MULTISPECIES: S-layer homology domain-containing protein [unclassified Lysinibacillus]MDM5250022.1 S-layer homology domain-containing protein [Lysinibacillus sp. G4S2]
MKKTLLAGALGIACFTGGFGLQANAQENVDLANVIHPKQVVAAATQVQAMSYQDIYKTLLLSKLNYDDKEMTLVCTKDSITVKISLQGLMKYSEMSAEEQKEFKEVFGDSMQMKFSPSGNSFKAEMFAQGRWQTLTDAELNDFIASISEDSIDLKPGGYFTDTIGHWAESYIQLLYQADIIKGTSATTFNPNGQVTRGQLASMIFRAGGLDVKEDYEGPATYKDLGKYPGAKEVAILEDYGLIGIFDGANFEPYKPVTREEMAYVTASLLESMEFDVAKANKNNTFADKNQMRKETVESIGLLQQLGVVDGASGKFNPKGNLTRAQFSKILSLTLLAAADEE